MHVTSQVAPLRLTLERSRIVSLVEPGADLIAACDAGLVWITVEGKPDIILRPGERAALPGRRLIVVQALEAAVLELATA